MNRVQILDAFRGYAALSVVFFHYTKYLSSLNDGKIPYFTYGYTGVSFFFIISGFVIFLSVQNSKSSVDFLVKRFSRLYPTFWLCLLISYLAVLIFGLPGREVARLDAIFNITMLPKLFGFKEVDGVYWSLLFEFFFYVYMSLVIYFNKHQKIFIWIIPWLFFCMMRQYFSFLHGPLTYVFNLNYGVFFIAGIMFYQIKFVNKRDFTYHLIIAICLTLYYNHAKSTDEALIVTLFFALFYLFSFELLNNLKLNCLVYIGKISFPLYLLHQNLGYIIINNMFNQWKISSYLFLIIPMIFSCVLASLVTTYFERPTLKYIRKYVDMHDFDFKISNFIPKRSRLKTYR